MSKAPEHMNDGRYRIERVLGVGGMAVVLLAFDNRMQVQRAIKLLHKRFSRNQQVRERFENEAYAQARLRHPHILTVHDVVEDASGVYLVMELAEGGSLADKVKTQGPLSPREAAQVGVTLCRALGAAHAEGVVHRDIKPENVLVDKHGTLKVADFGIARVVDRHVNLTQTGMVMGTWAYMPPEQRESARQVDGRADIYALGASLYYLLTGKQPGALHNPETHGRAYDGFPPALARVIQKATRLYPEDRYQTCEELSQDLEPLLAELTTERIAGYVAPDAPPETLLPALDDLSTYIHSNPDAAETLAPFLEPINLAAGAGTAVPHTAAPHAAAPQAGAPSLFLPPPGAPRGGLDPHTEPPEGTLAPVQAGSSPPTSTLPPATQPSTMLPPTTLPPTTLPPTTLPPVERARPAVTGSQLLLFVLGVLVAVLAIAVLLPRLVNPKAPAEAAPTADAATAQGTAATLDAEDRVEQDPVEQAPVAEVPVAQEPVAEDPAAPAQAPRGSNTGASGTTSTTGTGASSASSPRILTLAVDPAATSAATATQTPESSVPVDPSGMVVVKTVPSGSTVRAGGQPLTRSGRGYVLPIGSHVLEVTSPEGEQTRIPVVVRRDETVEICYSFDTNSACATP